MCFRETATGVRIWATGSAFTVPPAVPLAQQQPQLATGRPSESIGTWASDGQPFNSSSTPLLSKFLNYQVPALMMLPSVISEGMAPNIGVVIQSVSMSMMLDSGAELSFVPMEVAKHCNPPVQIPLLRERLGPLAILLLLCWANSSRITSLWDENNSSVLFH